jgi:hypothetical protein
MSAAPFRNSVVKFGNMKELNEKLARVSRVVVHPKYRTIGSSVKLLRESLPICGRKYVEMIAVMARYNQFAEHAGMTRIGESKPDKSILEAIEKLEQLGFTAYLLAVAEYNKQKIDGKVKQVKEILSSFSYPYNRRTAGAHGNFKNKDYRQWLENANKKELSKALTRLSQLNQPKIYIFWQKLHS